MTSGGRAIVAFVFFAVATPAWCQSTVDADRDPITWLKTYLGGAACVVYQAGPSSFRLEQITENTEVQFDGCQMVLQQASLIGGRAELHTFQIPLAALAENSVTSRPGFFLPEGWVSRGDVPTHTITIAAPAGKPLEERIDPLDGASPRDERTEAVTIPVRHEENASQIVRALTRAIERCRR